MQNELAESAEADQAAAEREHRFVHLGAALVADEQALELVQVREGALDDPPNAAEAGAVLGAAASDHRPDPARPNKAAVLVEVVAAVCDQLIGSPAWPADDTRDGRDPVEQRDQLGDVVAVAAGQRPRERSPVAIDEEVVLRASPAPIDRARPGFGAPFFAWM